MMKFLLLLTFVTLVVGDYTKEMMNYWERMKAMESCWGEENIKLYIVHIKKAIATCTQQDAPELSLPPFRSSYRFVNTMLNGANKMENQRYDIMEKMFSMMQQQMMQDNHQNKYNSYSSMDNDNNNWMEKMKMRFMMKQMMEKMDNMGSSVNSYDSYRKNDPMTRMSEFMKMFSSSSRSKRQAGEPNPSLDLGDRLVEKLNEQKRQMEEKVGNMTCVLREMGDLDANNKLDIRAMKKSMEDYTMPSPWFAQRYEEMLDTCYEMATNLPSEIEENAIVTGEDFGTVNLAELKSFWKCNEKLETHLCMNQDVKKKIEENFGPIEDILSQTKLTEHQLFPLVVQLLHGEEMQYMVGDF